MRSDYRASLLIIIMLASDPLVPSVSGGDVVAELTAAEGIALGQKTQPARKSGF